MSPFTNSVHPLTPRSETNNPNDSDFAAGASPPLILAFLAIGLFALSMVGVFGWRRFQFARMDLRGIPIPPEWDSQDGTSKTILGTGPRPVLWDLWTNRQRLKDDCLHTTDIIWSSANRFDGVREHETWETIMPISAVVTPPYPSNSLSGSTALQTQTPNPLPLYRWPRSIQSPSEAIKMEKAKVKDTQGNDERRLQVAVAIAMPAPHDVVRTNHRRGKENEREVGDANNTFAYTLGVYECAWSHEKAEVTEGGNMKVS
ncbi:hypothetical protein H0H93_004402 [Arthromyces matolae]|nr:hypothetical protein H0H93_004402 [Arthromyces matolae]